MLRNLLNPLGGFRHEPGDPPLRVRMDITNKCNLLCKMCHYPNTVNERKFDMSAELVQKIVDQIFPHAEWVSLACQYEAFMSQHIDEVLGIIAKSECKRIGIVSNATLWTPRRIEKILNNPAIETLSISIDGGTKETYERIRINGRWDKLVKNLENFAEAKRARGNPARPFVRMNTVLMKSTALELPQLVELAIRVGVMRIEAIRYLDINPDLDEAIPDWEVVMPSLIEAKKMAHDAGIELFLPISDPRLDIERDDHAEEVCNVSEEVGRFSEFCEAPWTAVQIYPNGDIHPCGYYGMPFGNLNHEDFLDIWNGKRYLELRRSLKTMRLHTKCAECNPHGYDNIERKARINKLETAAK